MSKLGLAEIIILLLIVAVPILVILTILIIRKTQCKSHFEVAFIIKTNL
jgi:hypothetical protein